MKKPRRLFNVRHMSFIALAVALGVIVGEALYGESLFYIAIPVGLGIALLILLAIFKKSRKFIYIPIALLVGFASMMTSNAITDSRFVGNTYSENITLTITSEVRWENLRAYFRATDIYVDGKKLQGNATVVIENAPPSPDYNAGDVVCITAGYVASSQIHTKFSTASLPYMSSRNNLQVHGFSGYKLAEGQPDFPYSLQMKIKRMYAENMDADSAALLNGLLLGDTYSMADDFRDEISYAGLAHVLAVSGLHISTLATALYFVLKKMRVNKKFSFVFVTAATLFYSFLCSFTPSSLRACVMSAAIAFSDAFGKKPDPMSALALAATLILVFKPLALFSAGFLLSFSAVFGIFLFYKDFSRLNMKVVDKISPKRHIGKRVAESVALTFAVSVGSFPFLAIYIGKLSIVAVLSNLIILPYMMVVYVVQLVVTIFALVTTLTKAVMILKYLLIPVILYLSAISAVPYLQWTIGFSYVGAAEYELCAAYASRFCFASRRAKVIGIVAALPVLAALALIA